VRHMASKLAQRHEPVTFWFVVGEHVAVSGQQQKIAQLRYGVQGLIPDGMLVRVSSIDRDTEAASSATCMPPCPGPPGPGSSAAHSRGRPCRPPCSTPPPAPWPAGLRSPGGRPCWC
jgi:hypothetical protein